MLTVLSINNFAIIKQSEIQFKSGMSAITGDTGAGKSILLDALQLILGARFDKATLQNDQKIDLSAVFDVSDIPNAKSWLSDSALDSDSECIIRRVINKDGQSRAFINGKPVTLSQIKSLASMLIGIYGQHAHYDLLSPDEQLIKLDNYLNEPQLLLEIKEKYETIKTLENEILTLEKTKQKNITEKNLLNYQLEELNELNLSENELDELSDKQTTLSYASEQSTNLYQSCQMLYDGDQSIITSFEQITQLLKQSKFSAEKINAILDMLEQAKVLSKEAYDELNRLQNAIEINPELLDEIDQRLALIYSISRKQQVSPEHLYTHHQALSDKLTQLDTLDQSIREKKNLLEKVYCDYDVIAENLSQKRKKAAIGFAKTVTQHIQKLNIPKGQFDILFMDEKDSNNQKKRSPRGFESCEFVISFNAGQPTHPIKKIASGGELSRIGLAIQVTASEKVAPPVLIFDEVDVGISGATAEIVGNLLSFLGKKAQVLTITHQAQVAAQADHHLHVYKEQTDNETFSYIKELKQNERTEEIARIIGGIKITEQTRAHAEEMLHKRL